MITIPQPALALNQGSGEYGFMPSDHYRMQFSRSCRDEDSVALIGTFIEHYIGLAGGRLEALIINAHGMDDGVRIGMGLRTHNISQLEPSRIRGRIGHILITACGVAGSTAGIEFCRRLAVELDVKVTAAVMDQVIGADDRSLVLTSPFRIFGVAANQIDDYEGTVYEWSRTGIRTTSQYSNGVVTGSVGRIPTP